MSNSAPTFPVKNVAQSMSKSAARYRNSNVKQCMKLSVALAPQEEAIALEEKVVQSQVPRKSTVMAKGLQKNKKVDLVEHMVHLLQEAGKVVVAQVDGLGEGQVDLQAQVEAVEGAMEDHPVLEVVTLAVALAAVQVMEDHLVEEAIAKVFQGSSVVQFNSNNVRMFQDNSAEL